MNYLFFVGLNVIMLNGSDYFMRISWGLHEPIFTKHMKQYVAPMDVKHASYIIIISIMAVLCVSCN